MEKKEIHKTEYIDKELPTIIIEKTSQANLSTYNHELIKISAKTSEDALRTYKEIREIENKK